MQPYRDPWRGLRARGDGGRTLFLDRPRRDLRIGLAFAAKAGSTASESSSTHAPTRFEIRERLAQRFGQSRIDTDGFAAARIDAFQVKQAILNVLLNALQQLGQTA